MKASRYIFLSLIVLLPSIAAAQVNDTYVIGAAGKTPGAFGTRWTTQLSIFNPQSYALKVSITFLPTGGGQGSEVLVSIPANALAFTDDVIGKWFHFSTATGALLVATFPEDNPGVANDVISRAFTVNSETFNVSGDGGTFGQTIPGVFTGLQDFATDGISAVANSVRNNNRQLWRTNIGAVNLGRSNVTLRVNVFDIDGRSILHNATQNLPPLSHTQVALPVEVNPGSVEFFVDDPSKKAVVFPYVSVIDQITGDPKYQSPTLLATANALFKQGRAIDPTALGKKIDIDLAREIRATAISLGEVESKTN